MFRIDWVEDKERRGEAARRLGDIAPNDIAALISDETGTFGAGLIALGNNQARLTLFIEPQRRRQGYGDLLLRAMLLRAAAANAFGIALVIPKEFEAWPRKLGFTEPARKEGEFIELFAYPEDIEWSACGS